MKSRPARVLDIDALIEALPAALAELARRGVAKSYRKGTILIEEGERGDTLYIVLAGRLRVYSSDPKNDHEVTYGSYGPGEYVGELGLDGGLRSASVIALEPCVCVLVTRETLLAHIRERPEFALDLMAKLIQRVRAATIGLRQMALNDVYGRIKLLLESMARPAGPDRWASAERLTHRDIASRLGCSREMISRVLKDLEQGGHLQVSTNEIRVRLPLPARW